MRPLLKHEDEIFWQLNEEKKIIFTSNYYSFNDSSEDELKSGNKKRKMMDLI